MKRLLFPLLLLLAGLGFYFSFFKKKAIDSKTTITPETTGTLSNTIKQIFTGVTGTGGTGTGGTGTGGTGTGGTGTGGTGTGGTGQTGATNPQGNTYEGGQTVYSRFNGSAVPSRGIGYLADGTLLTFDDTEYRDGEYKRIAGITTNVSGLIGSFNVDGASQLVYSTKEGVNLWDFYNAIGFLRNGNMVFHEVYNAGTIYEYSFYRT